VTAAPAPSTTKVLGVDLGSHRVGIAVSNSSRTMAFPVSVLQRSGDLTSDRQSLAELAREHEVKLVVVGLPLSLDGRRGPAAQAAARESEALADVLEPLGVRVVLFDERLTTVSASSALAQGGRRGKSARARIDAAAATVLLQAWLDAQ
jgi:putative Holliday junction resolvase